jgi:dihydrolipoamide dehydrogenase
LTAEAFVVATGTRWEPQPIANFPSDRLVTPDGVQNLTVAPASALVLGGGAGDADFGVEYAFLLAAAGSEVTMVTPGRLLPALDGTVADFARAALADAGVRLLEGADVAGVEVGGIAVAQGGQRTVVAADLVVAADPRRPFYEPLNLAAAGVVAGPSALSVDRSCRTNVAHIYAAGDVTGQVMLSSSATHMGEVAGENATGGQASIRLARPVHLLHTTPEIGWVGLSEEAAKDAGREVKAGTFDLSFNARAIVAGAREGIVKVVADCRLGEVLGVHAAGPGCAEILNVASALLQAEATVHDLAASVFWHPSMAEGLAEAARRAL